MAQQKIITKDTPPDVIERDIEETRAEMSETIDELQERFSAAHFRAEVKEHIRRKIGYAEERGKELTGRAKVTALKFGRVARGSSQEVKNSLLRSIQKDPAAANIIAFEAGVLLVIAAQNLMKRKPAAEAESLLPAGAGKS